MYVTSYTQRHDIFHIRFLDAKKKCSLDCLSHCLATKSFRKLHIICQYRAGTGMHKGDLLLSKSLRRQTRCCLFNALFIDLKGVVPCQSRYATHTLAVATNQIPLARFPACFADIQSINPRSSHWPHPCQPSIHIAVYFSLQYWHHLRKMMLVKYQVHLSGSQEMGVDLVFVINSVLCAITRLQTMTKHSQSVFKTCVLQPNFTGTT